MPELFWLPSPDMITDEVEMLYFITTVVLISTVACFVLWGRKGLFSFGWLQWVLRVVVALPLLVSGMRTLPGLR
jgi:hypothetical protein